MVQKDITIILLLFNTPNHILKNLDNYRNFKVAILDQSGDYSLKKKITKRLPNIVYYKISNKNNGFAKGINFLVKKIRSRYFLCTQPDVNIKHKSIIQLKNVFKNKKNCIISIPLINSKNTWKDKKRDKKPIQVKKIIGAIFLCDRKKFKRIHMFDENFFFYWEDIDLSKRIEFSNFNIYLEPKSLAIHNNSKSTINSLKERYIRSSYFKFGEYLYQYKHKKLKLIKIIREPIKSILEIIILLISFRFKSALIKTFKLLGILYFFIYFIKKKLI